MRFVIILAAAAMLSGVASAQNVVELKSARTPEERAAAFDAADANKDAKLDLAEFTKALPPDILAQLDAEMVAELKVARDTDFDGFVSRAEFLSPVRTAIHGSTR